MSKETKKMQVQEVPLKKVIPDDGNPRVNDGAVEYLKNSIRTFGFRVPMVVDENYVLLAGHTRLKAAIALGMKKVPVFVKTGLTNEEKEAYRIADNRSGELSLFNFDKVAKEILRLEGFDFTDFGFEPVKMTVADVEPLSVEGEIEHECVTCPRCGKVVK